MTFLPAIRLEEAAACGGELFPLAAARLLRFLVAAVPGNARVCRRRNTRRTRSSIMNGVAPHRCAVVADISILWSALAKVTCRRWRRDAVTAGGSVSAAGVASIPIY